MKHAARRIWVVDDDEAVCASLAAILETEDFLPVECTSASAFLDDFSIGMGMAVLLDVRMPGMDGLSLLENLGSALGEIPVIMMTAHADVPTAVRAMRAGAIDFVEKPIKPKRLFEAIERARSLYDPTTSESVAALRARFGELTPREHEVMREMLIGYPTKIIAHHLGLSPRTVEIHRGRVMQKTRAESLPHLVRVALKAGYDPEAEDGV